MLRSEYCLPSHIDQSLLDKIYTEIMADYMEKLEGKTMSTKVSDWMAKQTWNSWVIPIPELLIYKKKELELINLEFALKNIKSTNKFFILFFN